MASAGKGMGQGEYKTNTGNEPFKEGFQAANLCALCFFAPSAPHSETSETEKEAPSILIAPVET